MHHKIVHKEVNVAVDMVATLKQSDGSYKCNNCGEVFSGLNAEKHVVAAHVVEKCRSGVKFLCPECNKSFSSKSNLAYHMKMIHYAGPTNVLYCEDCEFVTKHKSSLERHKKRSHGSI